MPTRRRSDGQAQRRERNVNATGDVVEIKR